MTLKRIRLPLLVALSVMLNYVRLATLMKRNVLVVCLFTVKQNNDKAFIKDKFRLVVRNITTTSIIKFITRDLFSNVFQ